MRAKDLSKMSKISGVVFIAIGLLLAGLGFYFKSKENPNIPDAFNIYWMATAAAFILGIVNLSFKEGIRKSVYFSRIIVGALFVVSGIIKANDPLGFSFKLEEYFEPNALGWTYFLEHDWALPLSIIIAGFEIVLGLAVLLGGMIRVSSWALLGMILFFAWLTYYTASCNDAMQAAMAAGESFDGQCVLDCGCFGDALRGSIGRSLTPWESFFKDLALLILVIPIVLMQKHIKFNINNDDIIILPGALIFAFVMGVVLFSWWLPFIFIVLVFGIHFGVRYFIKKEKTKELTMAGVSIVMSFAFTLYTFTFLPVKDYRPYAIGNNLMEQMSNGIAPVYQNTFVYKDKTTGVEKFFSEEEFNADWENIMANYDYVDTKAILISEGKLSSISDFRPIKNYLELTEKDKADTNIQNILNEQYASYYEKVHVLDNVLYGYSDTVPEGDYDPNYYPLSDSTWAYKGLIERELQPGSTFDVNFTNYILSKEKCLIFVSYQLSKKDQFVNLDKWKAMKPLMDEAEKNGIEVIVMSSSSKEWTDKLAKELGRNLNTLSNDAIELKIIVRSNPGIIYLEKGVVKGKWDYNRIPNLANLK